MRDTGPQEREDSGVEGRALVEAAKRHDPAAWEAIYRSVYPRLRAYVFRRVGPMDVEDLVNETMTRAVAGIDRFTWGPAGIDGWLFGIARRVTADHARRSEREGRAMRRMTDPGDQRPVEENLEMTEDAAAVRAAFERLAPDERELLELRVVAGLTSEQTAAILGKRPGAVRMAQSRALTNLRRMLGDL
ncbi:MAG: RNA polymerase sigma factor [Acidimicrobiales bacterium]